MYDFWVDYKYSSKSRGIKNINLIDSGFLYTWSGVLNSHGSQILDGNSRVIRNVFDISWNPVSVG